MNRFALINAVSKMRSAQGGNLLKIKYRLKRVSSGKRRGQLMRAINMKTGACHKHLCVNVFLFLDGLIEYAGQSVE